MDKCTNKETNKRINQETNKEKFLVKYHPDCIPCFLRQTIFVANSLNISKEKTERLIKEIMKLLIELNWEMTPDKLAGKVHSLIRKTLGIHDPYYQLKKQSNKFALSLYPRLKKLLDNANNPVERLFISAKLSLAGNIIDFGPANEFDVEKTIQEVLKKELTINDFDKFIEVLENSDRLLYFADNAGEIVFDKLFIEEMINYKGQDFKEINFVVKGGPILNDAMLEDALEVGIDKLPNVKFSKLGNEEPNTGPSRDSKEIQEMIKSYPLVIAKGQANFEGFSHITGIFLFFIIKCSQVAKILNAPIYSLVIKYQ